MVHIMQKNEGGCIKRLWRKKNKRGKLTRGVLLFQDNAPAQTSQVATAAATKCSEVPYPQYSPNLVPITKTSLFKYIEIFTTKKWKFSDEKFW